MKKIEEYSSLKVTDSDNNSIKESVEFSEPSFRTNLSSKSELLLHFGIRVAEEGRERCALSLESCFRIRVTLQKKRERDALCRCVFKMKERSVIYSAPGRTEA